MSTTATWQLCNWLIACNLYYSIMCAVCILLACSPICTLWYFLSFSPLSSIFPSLFPCIINSPFLILCQWHPLYLFCLTQCNIHHVKQSQARVLYNCKKRNSPVTRVRFPWHGDQILAALANQIAVLSIKQRFLNVTYTACVIDYLWPLMLIKFSQLLQSRPIQRKGLLFCLGRDMCSRTSWPTVGSRCITPCCQQLETSFTSERSNSLL